MAWQTVSRKGGGKGWNQGVQDQLLQSMTAMQNSISQLAQSMNTRPPLGSKGQGKGKPPKGQGKGPAFSPGKRKNPNLKPTEERAEPTTEEVKCPKCPNTQLDYQSGLPLVRLQASPGDCPQSAGQANVKTGGVGSSSGASSGTSYASVVKGDTGPARDSQRRKGHSAKESRFSGETARHAGQRRLCLRGPRKPARTAPSCFERPSQPGGETRFGHGQNAQSRGQGPEMRRATPPGGSFLEICPCRKEEASSELKVHQNHASPVASHTSPQTPVSQGIPQWNQLAPQRKSPFRAFQGILGATLGVQNFKFSEFARNPILGMASHDLCNAKTRIL